MTYEEHGSIETFFPANSPDWRMCVDWESSAKNLSVGVWQHLSAAKRMATPAASVEDTNGESTLPPRFAYFSRPLGERISNRTVQLINKEQIGWRWVQSDLIRANCSVRILNLFFQPGFY